VRQCLATAILIVLFPMLAIGAHQYEQARFLDYSVYSPCHYDCQPFNVVYFNFCFQTETQVFIGRTWAWKWQYDPSKMAPLKGTTVSIRYDKAHIWVIRTDGKELRLSRAKAQFQNPLCN
jgi:hypothetical protein